MLSARLKYREPHPGGRSVYTRRWPRVTAQSMILAPILGAMAFDQEYKGERVHGIAKIHSDVATVTYVALGLAVVSVSIKF